MKECREAMEKQIKKEVIIKPWDPTICPTCNWELSKSLGDGYYKHWKSLRTCPRCGQVLYGRKKHEK